MKSTMCLFVVIIMTFYTPIAEANSLTSAVFCNKSTFSFIANSGIIDVSGDAIIEALNRAIKEVTDPGIKAELEKLLREVKQDPDMDRDKILKELDKLQKRAQKPADIQLMDNLVSKVKQIVDDETRDSINPFKWVGATGTGQTTGHIADIVFKNTSDQTAITAPQTFYIPSDGKHQSYVGRTPGGTEVPPGGTATEPVDGYCTDVTKPPVASGDAMPPPSEWIPVATQPGPAPGESPGISQTDEQPPAGGETPPGATDPVQTNPREGDSVQGVEVVNDPPALDETGPKIAPVIPTAPLEPFTPDIISEIPEADGFTPGYQWDDPDIGFVSTYPGTDIIIPGTIDVDKNPKTFAPLVVALVEQVEDAVTVVQSNPNFRTPFSGNPDKERESIVQQTVWISMGALTGKPYKKEDFAENVYEQFESTSGTPVSKLEDEDKEKVDAGVDAFWDSFMATGVEAKVISVPGQDEMEDAFGKTDSTHVKPHNPPGAEVVGAEAVALGKGVATGNDPPAVTAEEPSHMVQQTESRTEPEEVPPAEEPPAEEEEEESECHCESITASIAIYHHNDDNEKIDDYSGTVTMTNDETEIDVSVTDVSEKEHLVIDITGIRVVCPCEPAGGDCQVYGKRVVTDKGETVFMDEDKATVKEDDCTNCEVNNKPDKKPGTSFKIVILTKPTKKDDEKGVQFSFRVTAWCESDACVKGKAKKCEKILKIDFDKAD